MKFLRSIKRYWPDYLFLGLVVGFGLLYFVVYMTPGKADWYGRAFKDVYVAARRLIDLL